MIGVGSLSGIQELETASYFGCLALFTHYVIFMTFLPASLSLFLEVCEFIDSILLTVLFP